MAQEEYLYGRNGERGIMKRADESKTLDTAKKKIVLYNTTVDTFLNYGKKAITKMRQVFRFFMQRREVVLIWRPHPLLESVARAIHPELLDEYLELVNDYKKREVGIYDKSPDPYRAIALSDAYYGDWSSLVELYHVIGKPVFIQNMKILNEDRLPIKWAFYAYAFQIIDDKIYTTAPKGDALLYKERGQKLSIKKHLKDKSSKILMYSASVVCGETIIFAPWHGDTFLCYDIVSRETMEAEIGNQANNELYYLAGYGECVLAIGMESLAVFRYSDRERSWCCVLPSREKKNLFSPKRVKNYDYIPFIDKDSDFIYVYSINENRWISYPNQTDIIKDLMYDGERCWIITEAGNLVTLDIMTGTYSNVAIISAGDAPMFMLDCGETILFLPEKGAECTRFEKYTLQSEQEVLDVLNDGLSHYFSEVADHEILVESYEKNRGWHSQENENWRVYNYITKQITWDDLNDVDEECRFELEKMYAEECWANAKKRDRVLVENQKENISFLCGLLHIKEEPSKNLYPCGKRIYEHVVKHYEANK